MREWTIGRVLAIGFVALTLTVVVLQVENPVRAQPAGFYILSQTFYVPLPENEIRETLATLNPGDTSEAIESVISIAIALDGTVILYDHWEDGYEPDLPVPANVFPFGTTEVWGDGDVANGAPPGVLVDADDVLVGGDVIILNDLVATPATPAPGPPTVPLVPVVTTDPPQFNARDKFASTRPIAVTRVAWAPDPGTVLAGAVEVFPTQQWGNRFQAPIGEDIPSDEMFELVTGSYMAEQDETLLELFLDGVNDGTPDFFATLGQGEALLIPLGFPVPLGALAVTDKPVQLHAMTGDIGASWESRFFVVLPNSLWSSEYFVPVSTRESNSADPTDVWVYNPGTSNITVHCEALFDCTDAPNDPDIPIVQNSLGIPGGTVARFRLPDGSGARFSSDNEKDFYAIATIDANGPNSNTNNSDLNNRDFDWGLALVPTRELSTQALVGFAPSIDPTACGSGGNPFLCNPQDGLGSPVWVMAADTTIPADEKVSVYVDFDGDGLGSNIDPVGNNYDLLVELGALENAKIFDPTDNDNTGTLLYTLDGTLIAVAWGQDPANSIRTNPYFDAGTFVPALPNFTVVKEVDLLEAVPGDILTYTIVITNTSRAVVPDVMLEDRLPVSETDGVSELVTYIPNSTDVDNDMTVTPILDDGTTAFPLDEGGVNLGTLVPGQSFTVMFQVTVNELDDPDNPLPFGDDPNDECLVPPAEIPQTALINNATVEALGFTEEDDALTCVVFEPEVDIEKFTNGADADDPDGADVPNINPTDTVTWTYQVTNTGEVSILKADVLVSDNQTGVVPVFDSVITEVGGDAELFEPGDLWLYTASGTALDLDLPPPSGVITEDGVCTHNATELPRTAYVNLGTVTIPGAEDTDPSSYCNPPPPPPGGEGCTPGYWKQKHHFDSWIDFTPDQQFNSVFEDAFPGMTLLDVIKQGGGGLKALGRHTVAALLNSANPDVAHDVDGVIAAFNDVYPGTKSEYTDLKNVFAAGNEQGCPLN